MGFKDYNKHNILTKQYPQTFHHLKRFLSISLFLSLWLLLLYFFRLSSSSSSTTTTITAVHSQINGPDSPPTQPIKKCDPLIAKFYVHDIPPKFNSDILRDCHHLNIYTDMCPHVLNRGLGRPMEANPPGPGGPRSWFSTQQFLGEMIFHARLESHPCRTWDPSQARLFYLPFYAGLYASSRFSEKDIHVRDSLAVDFDEHLSRLDTWRESKARGEDHFIAIGRTAWDFMRSENLAEDIGGNRLLKLPRVGNMTVLTVERQPWSGAHQRGVPYPSYFHPATSDEMLAWMDIVGRAERPYLFSFVGGPRKGLEKAAVRDSILTQCAGSGRCLRVKCDPGSSACHDPARVLDVMTRSEFCMQPPGDSFTRRSVFDSITAGCIPVFFNQHTAYTQYEWYFPAEPSQYSVYLTGDKANVIEDELLKIPREKVVEMRKAVIDLIPSITYFHPNATNFRFHDAVDVALMGLTKLVNSTSRHVVV
ncbi:hypothetical protein QJS10_CPA03g00155 [Acorus calamus]|uniref:Exostosin GT47 domain-containing protein n=1 Tax=Acorus calamus TaxID=4465 RepID=A0AAV9F5X2_ACOCL|nr:hypothetical protein QJS10_CPA03g00155 [Acorus calamus]